MNLPIFVLTDAYKVSHNQQYPPNVTSLYAYGEFRGSFKDDTEDSRIVFYGIRYIIETYVARKWTLDDLEKCKEFYKTLGVGNSEFPFPYDLFKKFILENNGFFPVTIHSLPEGTVCYPHTPVYTIQADNEYAKIVTFLESILTMVWYPSTVATLSRRCRQLIQESYDQAVDSDSFAKIEAALHDFGFRGCTSVEQSIIGGSAHLLNFSGSDTTPAAYYVQYNLNCGKPIATSVPATEHSVMTSHSNEREAILQMIETFGSGAFACVMDSYDYANALENILPSISKQKLDKGGFMVLRPDSGDPSTVVLMALEACDKVFGAKLNSKGYKVLNGCGVIQGDGINYDQIKHILSNVIRAGFSPENVMFGMGAGLLQKVHRDTMRFATKLSFMEFQDGTTKDVMKCPKTDPTKNSLPGKFKVIRNVQNLPCVIPEEEETKGENLLKVVYDKGKTFDWDSFQTVRQRVENEWRNAPTNFNPVSSLMQEKIAATRAKLSQ